MRNFQDCYLRFKQPFSTDITTDRDEEIHVYFEKGSRIHAEGVWEQSSTPGVFYVQLTYGIGIQRVTENVFEIEMS